MANDLTAYGDAIASIESGGRYDRVGPTHPSYGRALGRYQVMEANLPTWLREAGLPAMTAEQFLASREAQDAVFQHRFGQYVQRYGPEGAAAAWFAGEGGMRNPNARDVLGTSVADYTRRFTAALGGQPTTRGVTPAGIPAPATAPGQPQDIQSIVADVVRQREDGERDALARTAMVGAAADDAPLQLPRIDLPQLRLPSMAPRRVVTTEQLRAGLGRRIGRA